MVKTIDSKRPKTELQGMQRWEDEGGQIIANSDASPEPVPARRHVASLRWDKRFVIQSFHRNGGLFWIRQEPAVKTG